MSIAPPPAAADPHHVLRTTSSRRRKLAGPGELIAGFAKHRHLIGQLTRREVLGRYRGSYLGLLWPFLNPIFLLIIYTVVFKYIFHVTFGKGLGETKTDFALILFSGLIVFNVFAECIARAPNLILQNGNYVNRVVFPLEILPVTIVLSSLFHLLMSFVPLVLVTALLRGYVPWTVIEWPLLLLPLFAYGLGAVWLLSALGVFLRDLNEVVLAATTILMYASAVFYSLDYMHKEAAAFEPYIRLNPLAHLVEQSRQVAVIGHPPRSVRLRLAGSRWRHLHDRGLRRVHARQARLRGRDLSLGRGPACPGALPLAHGHPVERGDQRQVEEQVGEIQVFDEFVPPLAQQRTAISGHGGEGG